MVGKVYLVGAGPGDPDLLTMRAYRLIRSASVIVLDRLVSKDIQFLFPTSARVIDVGKAASHHTLPQAEINQLLVDLAMGGEDVLRLKGGDPFVFGRGGEEAVALAAAGVRCEIVPGITSAIAAPAAAGVPVTYRGMAASFTVVTGHRQHGETPVNWRALAEAGGTIVVLMGVAQRGEIAAALIEGGLSPDTPVATVGSATTEAQAVLRCRLADLAATRVHAPATIVIGAVAALDVTALPHVATPA